MPNGKMEYAFLGAPVREMDDEPVKASLKKALDHIDRLYSVTPPAFPGHAFGQIKVGSPVAEYYFGGARVEEMTSNDASKALNATLDHVAHIQGVLPPGFSRL